MIEFKTWIVSAVFIILFISEHIWPAKRYSSSSIKRIIKNLSFWPVNIALSLAIIFPVTYWASGHVIWDRPVWLEGWAWLMLDILILDLFIYWWHRAVHEIQFFWRFHEIHHLDEHLDTSSAIRFHFGEIFFATFVRALVVIVFAIPFNSVIIFEMLVLMFTLFHHSNVALPPRMENILSKVIVTPSIHWVHHHAIRKDTDSNYATIFSFWDILFASKSKTKRFETMKIGVEKQKDKSFLRLLRSPFTNNQ